MLKECRVEKFQEDDEEVEIEGKEVEDGTEQKQEEEDEVVVEGVVKISTGTGLFGLSGNHFSIPAGLKRLRRLLGEHYGVSVDDLVNRMTRSRGGGGGYDSSSRRLQEMTEGVEMDNLSFDELNAALDALLDNDEDFGEFAGLFGQEVNGEVAEQRTDDQLTTNMAAAAAETAQTVEMLSQQQQLQNNQQYQIQQQLEQQIQQQFQQQVLQQQQMGQQQQLRSAPPLNDEAAIQNALEAAFARNEQIQQQQMPNNSGGMMLLTPNSPGRPMMRTQPITGYPSPTMQQHHDMTYPYINAPYEQQQQQQANNNPYYQLQQQQPVMMGYGVVAHPSPTSLTSSLLRSNPITAAGLSPPRLTSFNRSPIFPINDNLIHSPSAFISAATGQFASPVALRGSPSSPAGLFGTTSLMSGGGAASLLNNAVASATGGVGLAGLGSALQHASSVVAGGGGALMGSLGALGGGGGQNGLSSGGGFTGL
eukprot:GHVS01024408.1.p1 GENE.GHVS01024408.1~~GHVS01024408.1.p1  ORF type:complete len:478 (+),score=174.23 GHVS01024408.1:1353-2786(+)